MREADWRKNKRCLVAFGTHVFLSLLLSALVHLLGQLRHFFREPAGVCLSKARHRFVHPLRRVIVWLIILRRAPGTLLHLVGGLGIRDVVAGGVRDLDGVRTRTRGARGGGGRGGAGRGRSLKRKRSRPRPRACARARREQQSQAHKSGARRLYGLAALARAVHVVNPRRRSGRRALVKRSDLTGTVPPCSAARFAM